MTQTMEKGVIKIADRHMTETRLVTSVTVFNT